MRRRVLVMSWLMSSLCWGVGVAGSCSRAVPQLPTDALFCRENVDCARGFVCLRGICAKAQVSTAEKTPRTEGQTEDAGDASVGSDTKALDQSAMCGNGTCDDAPAQGEDCANCPADCGCPEGMICQDKICFSPTERCGDKICNQDTEDCNRCASDCECGAGSRCEKSGGKWKCEGNAKGCQSCQNRCDRNNECYRRMHVRAINIPCRACTERRGLGSGRIDHYVVVEFSSGTRLRGPVRWEAGCGRSVDYRWTVPYNIRAESLRGVKITVFDVDTRPRYTTETCASWTGLDLSKYKTHKLDKNGASVTIEILP